MLVLFLSAGIFLLSLLIVKMILNEINVKIAPFTSILFVFLIGFSNGVFFLLIRPSSYETSIACAAFMFLIAVFLFAKYLFTSKRSFILLIFTGLALALSVGSRPFYVFVIPLFFAVLIYDSRSKNISIKEITKRALFFAVPCALYGTVLAAYNYLRFDSIFEFGMSYQLNDMNFNEWSFSIKDLTAGLKHYLFRLPLITDSFPFISLNDSFYHKVAKELSMGIIFLFPMVFFFGLLPKFIKDTGVKKEAGVLLCLLSLVFVMNLIVLSIFGMTHRYIFEIMYISAIICNILFAYFYAKTTENKNRRLLGVLLCAIFFITIYVNVSTVISPHIVKHTIYVDEANHQKIRNFLL
jgi:4-amino-4-deoxy-L-arabinose transferase-like glycosyltransferase